MRRKFSIILFIIYICLGVFLFIDYKCDRYKSKPVEKVEEPVEIIERTIEYVDVWTITNADIKNEPNANAKTISNCSWNTKAVVTYIDNDWAKVKGLELYINRNFLNESPANYIEYNVPNNNKIKSYMDYKAITSTSSNQYKLQEIAYTDNGLRMVNDRYCVALGSYYTTTIGQYVDIELENGNVICGILADCKANKDTDSTNRIHSVDGSVVEFVVDTESLDSFAKKMGDISYINDWNSKVVNIKVYDKTAEY